MRALKIITGHVIYNPVYMYLQILTDNHPSNMAIKSRRDETINFSGRLAAIGGTLGLFAGISILSMVEVLCIIFSFVNLIVQFIRCKMEY